MVIEWLSATGPGVYVVKGVPEGGNAIGEFGREETGRCLRPLRIGMRFGENRTMGGSSATLRSRRFPDDRFGHDALLLGSRVSTNVARS